MEYNELGRTGLSVSRVGFGGGGIGVVWGGGAERGGRSSVDGAVGNGGPAASQAVTGSLTARLPVSGLTPEDLEGLALGDVILTDRGVDPGTGVIDWDVWGDGQLRFRGQPGDFDRSRAVVLEPLEKVP